MKTTPNQQLAIDIRDRNVLVSAAAGSGKTSVLVERIINRVTQDGVDIDRLLIMTFTNAAAAEMRSRIRDTIDDRIEMLRRTAGEDPDMLANLEKQSLLVHSALITTIHGFCKSVITDHFEEIGIDPGFRVADENECKLMQQDALDKCIEESYERGDESFLRAVEAFSKARNDNGIADLVIPVYRFIMADPDPEGFLEKCTKSYEFDDIDDFMASPVAGLILDHIEREYDRIREDIESAEVLLDAYDSLEPYRANIDAFKEAIDTIDSKTEMAVRDKFDLIRHVLFSIDPPRFGSIRGAELSDDELTAKDAVTILRDAAKSRIAKIHKDFPFDLETAFGHMMLAKEQLRALSALVKAFIRTYDAIKRDNNVIDFADMEHMAVKILSNPDIAAIYREHFVEIYVDEYQDTNMAQEMLVQLICRHDPGNVFQVGDVKQSIYRFRQARPEIFLGKYNTYTDNDGPDRRILLNDNFRSRRTVIDAVNEVFEKIMKADFGGIEYDRSAALKYGATCYDDSPYDAETYKSELIIGTPDTLGDEELQANIVASRINSMISEGYTIYDKAEDRKRCVSYRDFTILVRSIKKFEPVFRKVFNAVNIPLSVAGREGYFGTLEVRTALAFLSAVDNSYCDIELATLLRCPVGGFDDKDMAALAAIKGENMCLYDRIKLAAGTETENKLCTKCSDILILLDRYKVMSTNTPVRDILQHFIDNEYGDYVKCMTNAPQRMANLRMLLSKAEEYGRTSFKGLYGFVRYMDQIQRYEIDDGEAASVGENDDVVRLMTMHASKGLEFPVCFLAGLERKFNRTDEQGKLIRSTNCGFGVDFADIDRRICGPTLPKVLVRDDNARETIAEEMRILYVSMTRAREKLIMIATGKNDFFDRPAKDPGQCESFCEMIRSAYGETGFTHIKVTFAEEKDVLASRLEKKLEEEAVKDELLAIINDYTDKRENNESHISAESTDILKALSDPDATYPYPINPELRPKLSVSDLKHKAIEEKRAAGEELAPEGEVLFAETEPERYIPKFMRQEGETKTGATFYGTAFHRIMELWDYDNPVSVDDITAFAKRMHELHRMDKDQVEAVNPRDVELFLKTALAGRMAAADKNKKLFREQPFVIGVPEDGEMILVQGIIDAYFMEEDGITIVDYKTDRVTDENMLTERYRTQLEYYGKALSQITQLPVKALTIYSTCLKREITL